MRRFSDYNPISVTVYFLCMTLTAMFSMNPCIILPSMLCGIILYATIGPSRARDHLFAAALFVVLSLVNPLLSHNGMTVLFVMNDNPITLEALIYGMSAAAMIVGVLYLFRAYTAIMTSDRLLYVFGALSPKLSLVLSMALRLIPLMRRRYRSIEQTQRALGIYRTENIIDTIRARAAIFSILITWSLEDGVVTADSMQARAYGTHRRSRFSIFRWQTGDVILLFVSLALCALTVWGLIETQMTYYPSILLTTTTQSIVGLLSYTVLCMLPFIIQLREVIRWNGYVSRM